MSVYFEEENDDRRLIPPLAPIDFWVKHLTMALGIVGIWYFSMETLDTLPKLSLPELVRSITFYSLICYSLVTAYFLVHYFTSVMGRAKDIGIDPIVAGVLVAIAGIGAASFWIIQATSISATELQASYIYLSPFALLYMMVLLPSGTFGGRAAYA